MSQTTSHPAVPVASRDATRSDDAKTKKSDMPHRSRTPVLLDMDTGVDDALALMLALHCPELQIVGISTVSGNISSQQAELNTNFFLKQFGVEVDWKIRVGESKALTGRSPESVPHIHGIDGIGGLRAPGGDGALHDDSAGSGDGHSRGVQLILNQARAHRGKLRIVATGPLTNIARAIQADADAMEQIEGLYVMGGALDVKGNVSEFAEFNVFCDPEAYEIVLRSHVPTTLFPLDVTERVRLLYSSLNPDLKLSDSKLRLLRDLTRIYAGFHHQTAKFDGCYMHDAHPVVALVSSGLFEFRRGGVEVETADNARRGHLKWNKPGKGEKSTRVAIKVDASAFLDFYWKRLQQDEPECRY